MSSKAIIVIILAILFLIFVFQNIQTISVNFLTFEISMPRALLLIITFAIGLLIGIFMPYEFKKNRAKR
jgi:putative membrane protein